MRFSQIKKLCKEDSECTIFEEGTHQWIGTRHAAYPVEDVDIDTSSIKTLFDWPDVESDIGVGMSALANSTLCPDGAVRFNYAPNKWPKLEQGMPVMVAGEWINPLVHSGGVMFVREDRVKPARRKHEYADFRLAYNRQMEPLVVITNGFMVTGIVRPQTKREAELILETMGKMVNMLPQGTPGDVKLRAEDEGEIDGQITMDEMMEGEDDDQP